MQEKNKTILLTIITLAVISLIFVGSYFFFLGENSNEETKLNGLSQKKIDNMSDTINLMMRTNYGEVDIELFAKDAPNTVSNFVKLAKEGFYDGLRFHRIIKDFMIQGGDPNSKDDDWSNDGMGGPGYTFDDEINDQELVKGVLAMANSGPDTNGSQFFIVTAESTPWLDGLHTAFGRVVGGMDVIETINNVATDKEKGDHPVEDVIILSIELE